MLDADSSRAVLRTKEHELLSGVNLLVYDRKAFGRKPKENFYVRLFRPKAEIDRKRQFRPKVSISAERGSFQPILAKV